MSRFFRAPRLSEDDLDKQLFGIQVFFIVISGVIGSGIFSNNGTSLEVAGPAGLIISIICMGIIALCVGESIGEMVQKFPVYNAMVEYVRVFVDPDLAFVVGVAYWYAYASFFALQCLSAAELSAYWGLANPWPAIIFYFLAPVAILIVNWVGVSTYGWIETVGGALKVLLVAGTSILLYVIAARTKSDYITQGVQFDSSVISNAATAVLYTFPITAYGFLGLEILTVTAYEARDVASLRWPSMILPIFVFTLYFMITIGESLNVTWTYPQLPPIYAGIGSKPSANASNPTNPSSNSVVIIAVWRAGYPTLSGFLNGCLIFSALSTANTSLYVASRTLFGLTRNLRNYNTNNPFIKFFRGFTLLDRRVPVVALFVSWLSFLWLPYLQLIKKLPVAEFLEIMSISGSVACIIVWGSACLAYIRYESWIRNSAVDLETEAPRYWRRSGFASYGSWTFFFGIQPAPAYVGLAGCLLVIGSASATWWSTPASFGKAAVAYAAPVVFAGIFLFTKIVRKTLFKRWWVRLDRNVGVLIDVLENLELNRPVPRKRPDSTRTGGPTPSPQGVRPDTDEQDRETFRGGTGTGTGTGRSTARTRGGSGATGDEIEMGTIGSRSPELGQLHHAGTWRMGRDQSPSRPTPTLLDVPGSAH